MDKIPKRTIVRNREVNGKPNVEDRKRKLAGPFDEPDSHRTLALEVEGRTFWVSREVLASYSPVFKAMLYGDFAEAKKDTIELPDKKVEDIEELLLPAPGKKSIDFSNVELILKLGNEYQIEYLRQRASAELITMAREWEARDPRLLEILRISSAYLLKEALQAIVKRCGMEFGWTEFESSFAGLRPQVIAGLMRYRAGTPFGAVCRYEVRPGQKGFCLKRHGGHQAPGALKPLFLEPWLVITCIYCGGVSCHKCLENGEIEKASCKPALEHIDVAVRDLLNQM